MDRLAQRVAHTLWDIGAVHVNTSEYFRLPHAQPSPLYVDTRRLCSHPAEREQAVAALADRVLAAGRPTLVVGDETAGIPFAAWVAARLGCGMGYLRTRPKDYGLPNLLEGADATGHTVALVTDLVNGGDSLRPGLLHLRKNGAQVTSVSAVVNRSPWTEHQPFADLGVPFQPLTGTRAVVAAGVRRGALPPATAEAVLAWLDAAKADPIYGR